MSAIKFSLTLYNIESPFASALQHLGHTVKRSLIEQAFPDHAATSQSKGQERLSRGVGFTITAPPSPARCANAECRPRSRDRGYFHPSRHCPKDQLCRRDRFWQAASGVNQLWPPLIVFFTRCACAEDEVTVDAEVA
jgi:hypothetical protein